MSLVDYRPQGCKESDTTEATKHTHTHTHTVNVVNTVGQEREHVIKKGSFLLER